MVIFHIPPYRKEKIRDQGDVNAPTPHLRAERNLHSGCYWHPHMPSFWEKQSAHLPSQIVWNPAKGLAKKQTHAVGKVSPRRHLDLTQYVTSWTKPSSRVTKLRTNITASSEIGREALHQSQTLNLQLVPQGCLKREFRTAEPNCFRKSERGDGVCWTYLKNAAEQWQILGEAAADKVNITNRSFSSAQTFWILTLPLI